jgi:hypothetical protein
MRKMPLPFVVFAATAMATLPVACSKDQPPPATPYLEPDAGAANAAPTGAPEFDAGMGSFDTVVDGAIDLAIRAQAAQSAPSMNPDGQVGRATLQQGGSFNMIVTLQPNQCYTFIAYSPPGQVTELDMKLMAPPFNMQAAASGAKDKNMPIIGRGKANAQCPFLPVAIPYRIDVVAKQGTGRIGVHVFSRPK